MNEEELDRDTDGYDPYAKYKIKEYQYWAVYLHQSQYFLGRVYIWSKRKGFVGLQHATLEEWQELQVVLREVERVLSEIWQPDLFNEASLGNLTAQCHMHIIPRYRLARVFQGEMFRDERWGQNYAPYNYDFKVSEEMLQKIRRKIMAQIR